MIEIYSYRRLAEGCSAAPYLTIYAEVVSGKTKQRIRVAAYFLLLI
jgi:hypothetical protein